MKKWNVLLHFYSSQKYGIGVERKVLALSVKNKNRAFEKQPSNDSMLQKMI